MHLFIDYYSVVAGKAATPRFTGETKRLTTEWRESGKRKT